jgi:stage II sporulation protein M
MEGKELFRDTKRKDILKNTFDIKIYFIVCILFIIGIVVGTIYFRIVANDVDIKEKLIEGLVLTANNDLPRGEQILPVVLNNMKMLILYWIVGISVVGSPFLLVYCLIKGASLSFIISTIIFRFGFIEGNLYAFKNLFVHSCLNVFAIILLTVSSVKVSINALKNKKDIRLELVRHSIVSAISLIILGISAVIQTFLGL